MALHFNNQNLVIPLRITLPSLHYAFIISLQYMEEPNDPADQQEFFTIIKPKPKNSMVESKRSRIESIQSRVESKQSHIEAPSERPRITMEDIVAQQNTPPSLIESIICPLCMTILPIPYYECEQCSNSFCPECMELWWIKSPKSCAFKCQKSSFKSIKRSNTYNALSQIIKIRCNLCKEGYFLSQINSHPQKLCPEVEEPCCYKDCQQLVKRKDKGDHQKTCKFKPVDCQHCQQSIPAFQFEVHVDQICQEKLVSCIHEPCKENVRRADYELHIGKCQWLKMQCPWCKASIFSKDYKEHENGCEHKIIDCQWCKQSFLLPAMLKHECVLREQVCQLCQTSIQSVTKKEHRAQCTFYTLVKVNAQNSMLKEVNERLQKKVFEMEEIINQFLENRQSQTLKMIKSMQEKEKLMVEKDLLRIENSVKSVLKLQNEETQAHLKFPHLIQSWCPVCKDLDKKFKAMMDPLIDKKKQVLTRLTEMKRMEVTPQ